MRAKEKNNSQNFGKSIRQLASYCRNYAAIIMLAVLLAMAGAVLSILGPNKLSDITNLITEGLMTGIDISAVVKIAGTLLCMYGAGFIFNLMQGILMANTTQAITKNMRRNLTEKVNKVPLRYFDRTTTGDVLSRITNDVDMIGQTLNQSIGTLVSAVTMFFGSLFMMFYTNWVMALSGVAATLTGFLLMILIITKSQKYFVKQQEELGHINGHIEETYSGHSVVKVYNGKKEALDTFDNMNDVLYNCAWKSQFMSGLMQPLMAFIGNFGYVVVCIVGAALALSGKIEFGTIVAFIMYIRLFTQPLSQIAQAANNLQSAAAASKRVFEFLGEEEISDESNKTKKLKQVRGTVEFKHVKFGYTQEHEIIHDFSASVKAGQKVAIVGPTGAGKTTLVNLLMRFYEINSGEICIDGVPITDMRREEIHDLFGMVLQDTWLFEGTIRENIVYNKADITEERLINACREVGLHRYISSLPEGYDTVLDDQANFSAGQKQLVTIARAMAEDSPMLILDEATSSIDTRTEILIQKAMDKLMTGRTSFIIAHRLSTIRDADMILVMKDGDVIETGNHEELMRQNGFYASLYNSQFEQAS